MRYCTPHQRIIYSAAKPRSDDLTDDNGALCSQASTKRIQGNTFETYIQVPQV